MSVDIPPATSQLFPRSVGMSPGGPAIPASTLRVMLARGRPIEMVWSGYTLEPCIGNSATLRLSPEGEPAPGDVALCDVDGWGDLRRILERLPDGAFITAIDAWPRGREHVERRQILAVVVGARGAGDRRGRLIAALFRFWSRLAAPRMATTPRGSSVGGGTKATERVTPYGPGCRRCADSRARRVA